MLTAHASAGLNPFMVIGRTRLDLGLEDAVDDYQRLVNNLAALGARWLLDCGTSRPEHFDVYCELMRRVAPLAAAAGLQITLKPHGGLTLTGSGLAEVCRRVDHPAFGVCYDPGNIVYYSKGECRPESDVEKVIGTVNTGIIKDCVLEGDKPDVAVTAGDGLVDFPTVLGKLAAGGFNGPYYVECVGSREPQGVDRDLAFTLGYVRGILEALAGS